MKKNIFRIVYIVLILALTWIAFSFINTVAHNASDYNYAAWNFFNILC